MNEMQNNERLQQSIRNVLGILPETQRSRPFALVDALGFRSRVEKTDLTNLYIQYAMLIDSAWTSKGLVRRMNPEIVILSDTVALFPPTGSDSREFFSCLVQYLAVLVYNSVVMEELGSFPVRGTITFGRLIAQARHQFPLSLDGLPKPPIPVFLGAPIVDALAWEADQKWIGASISPRSIGVIKRDIPEVLAELVKNRWLVEWNVPTGYGLEPTFAVNFVLRENADRLRELLLTCEHGSPRPDVAAKYRATRLFVEFICQEAAYHP